MNNWQTYAIASAFFAGLTAIFGKIGVSDINSNFATFVRTIVILIVSAGIVTYRHEWTKVDSVPGRSLIFLVLSGIATGLSWLCYYRALQIGPASRVAPVDKLSVAFAIIMGILVLGEPFNWKVAFGGTLIVAGSLVLAFS
ncbi:MAG: EamA family transporter [Oligoflexales bacterium]